MTENKQYNIILMSPLPPPVGGIGTWTLNYSNISKQFGINVTIVDEKIINRNRDVFGKKSKRNFFSELKRSFNIWKNLKKACKNLDNKIVHCCIPALSTSIIRELISLKISHHYKKKFVIHFHSTCSKSIKNKFDKWLFKKIIKKSDSIITLNSQSFNFVKEMISNKCYFAKIFLIENFADDAYLNCVKTYNPIVKNIFYCGGVTEQKGAKIIIDLAKKVPNINFRLAGKVDDDMKIYKENSHANNVFFLGILNRDDIKKEYLDDDIFLFPTYYENEAFSISLLEAMSFGMPCIATDWAANNDMLSESNELIVPIRNVDEIVKKINYLGNQNIRKTIGEKNKNKVMNCYSREIIFNKYLNVYDFLNNRGKI